MIFVTTSTAAMPLETWTACNLLPPVTPVKVNTTKLTQKVSSVPVQRQLIALRTLRRRVSRYTGAVGSLISRSLQFATSQHYRGPLDSALHALRAEESRCGPGSRVFLMMLYHLRVYQ